MIGWTKTMRIAFVAVALTQIGCSGETEKVEAPKVIAIPVETMVVSERPFVDRVDVSGVAQPMHEVRVAAEAPGRVLSAPCEAHQYSAEPGVDRES